MTGQARKLPARQAAGAAAAALDAAAVPTIPPEARHRIEACPFFAALPEESRAALLQVATLRFWPAKATILSEGAYPDRVCVVVSGLVQLCTVFEEREVSLLLLTPGSAFAVSAVLRQEPLIASARAVLPSVVVDIPAQEIHARLAGADSFATLLLHDLASSYRVLLQAIGQRPKRLGGGTGGCGHARHPLPFLRRRGATRRSTFHSRLE